MHWKPPNCAAPSRLLDRRKLAIPATIPSGLSDAFVQDAAKQKQWAAFLKKNRLDALDLADVVALLCREFQKLVTH